MSEKGDKRICHFCSTESLYTCPKCNVQYCSSKCYKCPRHLQCSENFYKGLVEEQLKGATASEDSKQKMHEILQRMQQDEDLDKDEDSLDSDDDDDITERMKEIDLNDSDAVWLRLSQTEQREFLDIIKEGRTTELIPPWEAWWETNSSVTELKKGSNKDVPAFMEICPPILDCPPLSQVMKTEPSPCIPFNILNTLASYVWTVRIFNGDHQDNCVDATEAVFTLSPVLAVGANYSSAEIAVNVPKVEAEKHSWLSESEEFSLKVEDDVKTILKGPIPSFRSFYVAAALSDIHSLFVTCKSALAPKKKKRAGIFTSSIECSNQEITKRFTKIDLVKNSIKKIEFYLSYIKEYPNKLCIN